MVPDSIFQLTVGAVLVAAGVLCWFLTGAVRRYALARSVIDVPNHRSSHSVPTPRGGGIAIAVVVLVGTLTTAWWGWVPSGVAFALAGGGGLVAMIGWIDDRRGLSAGARAVVHVIAAGWVVFWLHGPPVIDLGMVRLPLGMVGSLLVLIGVVWMINLYNFMDGIDGIAAGEAASTGVIGGALLLGAGEFGLAFVCLLTAAACAGFLVWNWHPARIFMGDVGSGFLGIVFAAVAVESDNRSALPLLVWALLLGVFIFDSTITLVRRLYRRERWYAAHRSHAYQRAVQAGLRHSSVTGGILALNLVFGGGAWLAFRHVELLPVVMVAGLAILTWVYARIERLRPMGRPARVAEGSQLEQVARQFGDTTDR